jgi:general secretion pathway protein N
MNRFLLVLLALLVMLLTVAVLAPAQWLAAGVRSATGGRVELAEASGSIWNGQATVVLASGTDAGATRASLPERLSWRLSPWSLLVGTVDVTFSHPSALAQPLNVRAPMFGNTLTAGPTTLRMPATLLTGLGAPWNTIRPGGVISINWNGLSVAPGKFQGAVVAEWQFASSALTPVSPFGHYRMQTNGVFPGTQLNLSTISGPLELKGSGTIAEGGRLRFQGRAQPLAGTDDTVRTQLNGLISLLGRRDGDAALLNFGN